METGAIKRLPFICPPAPAPLHGIRASIALAQEKARDLPELFERAISPAVDWFWAKTRQDNPSPDRARLRQSAGRGKSISRRSALRADRSHAISGRLLFQRPRVRSGAETVELI